MNIYVWLTSWNKLESYSVKNLSCLYMPSWSKFWRDIWAFHLGVLSWSSSKYSVMWSNTTSTLVLPSQYWIIYLHSIEYPSQYWMKYLHCIEYPPQYWMIYLHSTKHLPMYLWYHPTVVNFLHSTDGLLQYWWYLPKLLMISPQSTDGISQRYWWYPPEVLMVSPKVLMESLYSAVNILPT